jgi:Uncharacterized protein conserved in bacteria
MKNLFIIIIGAMFLLLSSGVSAKYKLTVVVDNIVEIKGKLMIGIYNSDSTFMKKVYRGYAVTLSEEEIVDSSIKVELEPLPEGEYAISLYQDVNSNDNLDADAFGIPKEGYGFSNNAKGFMGPPDFEKAKFSLRKDGVIRINLVH